MTGRRSSLDASDAAVIVTLLPQSGDPACWAGTRAIGARTSPSARSPI
jgi:hypothetical protein